MNSNTNKEVRFRRAAERVARAQEAMRSGLASDLAPPPRWACSGDAAADGLAAVRAARAGLEELRAYCVGYGRIAAHGAVCRLLRQLGEIQGAILGGRNDDGNL